MMKKIIRFLSLAFVLLAITASCSSNSGTTNDSSNETKLETEENVKSGAVFYKIEDSQGKLLSEIMINGTNIELKVENMHYKSKLSGEKRKYQSQEEEIVAEVKFKGEESMKLRTPDAQLKWKVKFYDDKVKISDNEENLNPYQIKFKEESRSKVYTEDNEIGDVRFADNKIIVKGKGIEYHIKTDKMSSAFGVMLMEASELDKTILIAELLAKGL
jgi:hypothetical protein